MTVNRRLLAGSDGLFDDEVGAQLVDAAGIIPQGVQVWAAVGDAYAAPDGGAWTAATRIRFRVKRCDTNGAIISIDGGTTDHVVAHPGVCDSQWYVAPAGSVIQAKNAVALSAAANLSIEWA